MAGHTTQEHTVDPNDVPQISMADHMRTYEAFLSLTKYGIIAIVVLLIGMAFFLT